MNSETRRWAAGELRREAWFALEGLRCWVETQRKPTLIDLKLAQASAWRTACCQPA